METSAATRPGLELNCLVVLADKWLIIIEWADPGLNSRPGLCLLKDVINPQPLNGAGFYTGEASIQGNAGHY